MPFGTVAPIPERPDLAQFAVIKKVNPINKSTKPNSPFYSAELELEVSDKCPGGRDASYYLAFLPEFFTDDFDQQLPALANAPAKTAASAIFAVYGLNIAKAGGKDKDGNERAGRGALQAILGTDFQALIAFCAPYKVANPPTIETLNTLFAKILTGRQVGVVLTQGKDEDGALRDNYNAKNFFSASKEGLDEIEKSAGSKRRKKPLILTWKQTSASA